jgi:oligosaccharide repeat unit polymerase
MQNKSGILLFLAVVIQIFSIVIIAIFKETNYFQPESLVYPGCCLILGLTVWSFASWAILTKSIFHPYTIFLLSAILFNGGQTILEVFHLNENGLLKGQFSGETLSNTVFFVFFGFSAFHLGALLSLLFPEILSYFSFSRNKRITKSKYNRITPSLYINGKDHNSTDHDSNQQDLKQLDTTAGTAIVGWVLLSISLLPAVYVFTQSIKVVLTSGYQGLYQGEQATSVAAAPTVLATFLMPATMFLLASSHRNKPTQQKTLRITSIVLVSLDIISQFLLGQRRNVATRLFAFLWLWNTKIKKIPSYFIAGGAVLLAVIFPIVAATRNMTGSERFSMDVILAQFASQKNVLLSTIGEMGGSMMTIAYTLELVPSTRPFQMGADYGYALLTLMPNFFWTIHPTIARGLASTWLVWAVDPSFAMVGGGYGYSFIAEAYLNFGWIGGPIILGLIGFFYCLMSVWAVNSNSIARTALIATFTAFFPFYARSESALFVRGLVWYCVMPYVAAVYLSRRQSKLKSHHSS